MSEKRRKIDEFKLYSLEPALETIIKLEELGYLCDLKTINAGKWKGKTYIITTFREVDN